MTPSFGRVRSGGGIDKARARVGFFVLSPLEDQGAM